MSAAALLFFLFIAAGSTAAEEAKPEDVDRFLAAVARMETAIGNVRDYTCIFRKQERIGDELLPEETIFQKHRGPGVCLYMKWIAEPHLGREVIFCEGRYGNQMKVQESSGIASWFTLSLDPHGTLANRSSRRPITQAGLFNAVDFITKGFAGSRESPAAERVGFRRVYESEESGEPAICAMTVPPGGDRSSGEVVSRILVCIDKALHLPVQLTTWDAEERLLGSYGYHDLLLNVGLTDADFEVENEEYGF